MMQKLYFSYGSNMNLEQMKYRCPKAIPLGPVTVQDYRLAFRGSALSAVATIIPEKGSHVDGVMWLITPDCEKSLDRYEGAPSFYGKQNIETTDNMGNNVMAAVYVMNAPQCDRCGIPSRSYADGILQGAEQNGVDTGHICNAFNRAVQEYRHQKIDACEVEQMSFCPKPKRRNWYTR